MRRGEEGGEEEEKEKVKAKNAFQPPLFLRRSRVRTEILMYLYSNYPEASRPEEIAHATGIELKNVLRGLTGKGGWLPDSDALLNQGVVEQVEYDGSPYFRLTERGKAMIERMQRSQGENKRAKVKGVSPEV